jgi:glycolate oxidase iron-sulfur subunit
MTQPIAIAPEERFLDCVHCGLCLTACPTYMTNGLEADSPRGRIYLMRELQAGRIAPTDDIVRHLDLCLGCRACETACPSGVQYGSLIEAARPAIESVHRRRWLPRITRGAISSVVASPGGQRWLALAARMMPRSALSALARTPRWPDALRYWAAMAATLPRPSNAALPAVLEPRGPVRGEVALLTGCIAHTFFASTNRNAARLLAHAGFRVHIPPASRCCGALLLHLGRRQEATALAGQMVEALRALPVAPAAVITTAAGCGAMVREYGALLGDAASAAVGASARDVTSVLADATFPTPPRPLEQVVTYHDPCHLAHAQGVRDAPRALLQGIPGLELVDLFEADTCCGSAGTYNVTQPTMARQLMVRKIEHILQTGASVVTTPNPGCLLQIRAGLLMRGAPVTAVHPVDLLAAAYLPSAT